MRIFSALFIFASLLTAAAPSVAQPSSSAIAGAWAGEEQYWATTIAGEFPKYLMLFDNSFLGWPCLAERPRTKADLIETGTSVLGPPGTFLRVSLEDKAATGSDSFVVVYYRARGARRNADGKSEEFVRNFTHTWVKRPEGWRIIGGMCRDDVRAK